MSFFTPGKRRSKSSRKADKVISRNTQISSFPARFLLRKEKEGNRRDYLQLLLPTLNLQETFFQMRDELDRESIFT